MKHFIMSVVEKYPINIKAEKKFSGCGFWKNKAAAVKKVVVASTVATKAELRR